MVDLEVAYFYMSSNQSSIWVKCKMVVHYGEFPPGWEMMPGEAIEYRKKIGAFEIRAREEEGFCEKCGKRGLGFSFNAVDSRGDHMGESGAYWCPECGEGMNPKEYENFVKNELITPEM